MEERPPAMGGSCEYIEYAATDKLPPAWGLGMELTTLHRKK
jgi:hypothetical protein